ncbi:MAG: Flp pilus assembly protein CpaB [Alphaproteobacteria bacterium]|nr:Flp pilus assembly protein CpaB [Alphaproteobacteria bacterium]
MSIRNVLLFLTAVLVAGGAVYFAQSWLDAERAALEALRMIDRGEEPEADYILVAKKHLARGTFVKEEDLRWQAWPDETLDKAYIVRGEGSDPKSFEGAVVRFPIVQGEPVTSARLVRRGERGFLAAALRPGKRAITIPISVTTGVAGFVLPGDHVDMLLTHRLGRRSYATETLIPDLRVIAIDQRLNQKEGAAKVSKTLTFEVDPKQVEMVTVARRLGSLSLSLRSLAEDEAVLAEATQPAAAGENGPESSSDERKASSADGARADYANAAELIPNERPIMTASLRTPMADTGAGAAPSSIAGDSAGVASTDSEGVAGGGDPIMSIWESSGGNPLAPDRNRQDDGRGYTFGQEVSLLLLDRAKRKKVTIIRGGRRQSLAAKASPSEAEQDDEEEAKREGDESDAENGEDGAVEVISEGE